MRFAIISSQAFSLTNFRYPLIQEILERGHQVLALAPDFDETSANPLIEAGVQLVPISLSRTGINPLRDIGDIIALRRVLLRLNLDVVLTSSIKPVIYGTLAASWARVPNRFALIAGLGYAFGENTRLGIGGRAIHYVARGLYKVALGQAQRVFMQNPDDAAEFQDMGIVPAGKIVRVNGTGVELHDWKVLPPVTHPPTFVLAARLLAEKGIFDYIEAARIVKSKSPKARFILLGGLDSNPNAISRAQVDQWVQEGIVEWPGHVDVRPWLAQCSVYVLPSYYREGIPRSTQEALASARPVITTDAPGCRETVISGENGFLIRPRDPVALAEAMMSFVETPHLIETMGAHSRKLAEERFDVHAINRTMIETMGL